MEELLMQLARTAQKEQAVASQTLDDGMQLLVYPMQDGMLVALGFSGELAQAVRMEQALRRRSEDMARYGVWHAAVFADGSCYVARRMMHVNIDSDEPFLSADDLMAAEELLA
jgi:hypothetical protein